MRDEVLPKNILMIGPTGVGKTEISRRLSKLAEAPFIKVEATRFTEVGYVGRDVEQIIRDLIEIAIAMEREKKRKEVKAKAELKAEEKVLDALVGNKASVATRESFRKRLRTGDLDNNEIEIEVQRRERYKFDLHGFTLDEANKKVKEIIEHCFKNKYREILIITGKGMHSTSDDDTYVSKDLGKLKHSVPDFLKNNSDLSKFIISINDAEKKDGGEGAIIIKLKNL